MYLDFNDASPIVHNLIMNIFYDEETKFKDGRMIVFWSIAAL